MEMITLEQYEQIRRMYHLEEKSGRQIAHELGCSRQTVSRALSLEQPPTYTMSKPRSAPVLGPYQAKLEELLAENQRLPKKQRYTAHKLFQLIQAQGYGGSEAGVQMYAVRWRKANKRPATFLPLEFEPGQDAKARLGRSPGHFGRSAAEGAGLRDASVLLAPDVCHDVSSSKARSVLLWACARLRILRRHSSSSEL